MNQEGPNDESKNGVDAAQRDAFVYKRPFELYLSRNSKFCTAYRAEWEKIKSKACV